MWTRCGIPRTSHRKIMLFLSISCLLLTAAVGFIVFRSVFFPPVTLSLVWAVGLTLILVSGDYFFRLSDQSLLIFIIGPLAFLVGSSIVWYFPINKPDTAKSESSNR